MFGPESSHCSGWGECADYLCAGSYIRDFYNIIQFNGTEKSDPKVMRRKESRARGDVLIVSQVSFGKLASLQQVCRRHNP